MTMATAASASALLAVAVAAVLVMRYLDILDAHVVVRKVTERGVKAVALNLVGPEMGVNCDEPRSLGRESYWSITPQMLLDFWLHVIAQKV